MNLTQYRTGMMLLAVTVLLFFGPAAFAQTDNLDITGGVPGVACGNPSVSSGSLSFSCPPSPFSGVLTSSGSGNLSTGVFGASTEVSGVSYTTGVRRPPMSSLHMSLPSRGSRMARRSSTFLLRELLVARDASPQGAVRLRCSSMLPGIHR
jgi:hypothetical protein